MAMSEQQRQRKFERLQRQLAHAEEIKEKNQHLLTKILGEARETSQKLAIKEQELQQVCSQVRHDIKSPLSTLNSILACNTDLSNEDRPILNHVLKQLGEIIADLDPSAEDSDREKQLCFDIQRTTSEILDEKKIQYPNHTIEFQSDLGSETACRGRASDFRRVLSNLINNSVEASIKNESSQIFVKLEQKPNSVRMLIRDSGCGIADDIGDLVFQRGFSHGKPNGSGLGLAQAKDLIQSWDGDISFKSKLGNGTTLSIELPTSTSIFKPKNRASTKESSVSITAHKCV